MRIIISVDVDDGLDIEDVNVDIQNLIQETLEKEARFVRAIVSCPIKGYTPRGIDDPRCDSCGHHTTD